MPFFLVKLFASAAIIAAVSEVAKRNTLFAGIIGALPLVSVLAFCWLYYETKDTGKISALSLEIFWFTIPSLTFFIALPLLLKQQIPFVFALLGALAIMGVAILLFNYGRSLI